MDEEVTITEMEYLFDRESFAQENCAFVTAACQQNKSLEDLVKEMKQGIAAGKLSKTGLYNALQGETQNAIQRRIGPCALLLHLSIGALAGIGIAATKSLFCSENFAEDALVYGLFGFIGGTGYAVLRSLPYGGQLFNPPHPHNKTVPALLEILRKEYALTWGATKTPVHSVEEGYAYSRQLQTQASGHHPDYAMTWMQLEFEKHALVDEEGKDIFALVLNNSKPLAVQYGDKAHILLHDPPQMSIPLMPFPLPCSRKSVERFKEAVHPYLELRTIEGRIPVVYQ